MSRPGISGLRGMSDPFFFAFDVLTQGQVLCHGVIFTSFIVHSDEKQMKLCALDDDLRMLHFVDFIMDNYGKETIKRFERMLKLKADELNDMERKLATLRQSINQVKRKHE